MPAKRITYKKILSIDGGGIRGVIPAVMLTYLEKEMGKPIAEMFDLIVGTSTGGILAAGLTVPGGHDKMAKHSAKTLLNLYEKHGNEIFGRSLWQRIPVIDMLTAALEETYDHKPLEDILRKYFGDAKLTDCLVPVVLTSYDIERRDTYFFKTSRARTSKDRNHYLRDAARATSAAPTYFEPAIVKSLAKNPTRRVLIDGGVFANNPTTCAYVEAISLGAKPEEIVLASLGTGVNTRKITYEEAKGWGTVGWARPITSVMMDGSADATHYHLSHLLPDNTKGNQQRYFRFDEKLKLGYDDIDDASQTNINALKAKAAEIIADKKAEIAKLMSLL